MRARGCQGAKMRPRRVQGCTTGQEMRLRPGSPETCCRGAAEAQRGAAISEMTFSRRGMRVKQTFSSQDARADARKVWDWALSANMRPTMTGGHFPHAPQRTARSKLKSCRRHARARSPRCAARRGTAAGQPPARTQAAAAAGRAAACLPLFSQTSL
eukprot:363913-Chlamydomonas_euryale.AAC.6